MPIINIGIVGCGRILNAHLRGYKALRDAGMDNFRIVALCSRDRENALRFRSRGQGPPPLTPVGAREGDPLAAPPMYVTDVNDDVNIAIYTDYHEMIDRARLSAIDICAALPAHHEVGLYAIKGGLHVIVEKPIALTVRMARAMANAAEDVGVVLSVAESARFNSLLRAQKWAIEQGLIGNIQMVLQGGVGLGIWSPDRVLADTPWRHDKLQAGGGVSLDLGVHLFNRVEYLCGKIDTMTAMTATFEPKRKLYNDAGRVAREVDCNVDDAFMAVARFANGALGQFSLSTSGHGPEYQVPGGIMVYGSKGCLREGKAILDDGSSDRLEHLFDAKAPEALKRKFFPFGIRDGFAIEKFNFLTAIEQNRVPEMDGYQGLRDLAAAYSVLESAAAGRPVKVQDVEEGQVEEYQKEINAHYGY